MVPRSLRTWFIIHFVVDLFAGLPLFIAPSTVSELFGVLSGEPFIARMLAAAFLAIGTTSLICRNAPLDAYKALLKLKIIWSSLALAGLMISLVSSPSPTIYLPIIIFVPFWVAWIYFYKKITAK